MQISLTAGQTAFRDEVREFLDRELPADIARRVKLGRGVAKEDLAVWTRILNARGWAAPNWPEEYGGTGWTSVQKYIFADEQARVSAPAFLSFGVSMVGPIIGWVTLGHCGGEASKQKHSGPTGRRSVPKRRISNSLWASSRNSIERGSNHVATAFSSPGIRSRSE